MLTLPDKLLIVFLALLTLFSYSLASNVREGKEIRIESDGKLVATYPLNSNNVFDIKGALGVSRIGIKNGRASFSSSPCKNKTCIHQGELSKTGQMAACLPNRVVMRVSGGGGDYDAVTR